MQRVLVGYPGGKPWQIHVNGDKEVSIFGEKIRVNAEIHNLEVFSAMLTKRTCWTGCIRVY